MNDSISKLLKSKYSFVRLLGEGSYGKANLVRSKEDKVTRKNNI